MSDPTFFVVLALAVVGVIARMIVLTNRINRLGGRCDHPRLSRHGTRRVACDECDRIWRVEDASQGGRET